MDRHFRRKISVCERAWHAGVSDAVVDAIALCDVYGVPPPAWLAGAVRALVARTPSAKRKMDLIHYARWDAVQELRDRKGEEGLPKTWEECYARVSAFFEGTQAQGSPETIKRSYQLVARGLKSSRAHRYYLGRLG
jgi:hypothetical protein